MDQHDVHTVESPIAVQPVTLRAAPELLLSGREGTTTLPVGFGYDGAYTAPQCTGCALPTLDGANGAGADAASSTTTRRNTFPFRGRQRRRRCHGITVPADQLFLRVALFDEFTDGQDDLDLYLFFCPSDAATARRSRRATA